jgi:glycosyltransferase involved in cell wall biosynthesis
LNKRHEHKENIVLHDIFDIRGGGERLAISLIHALEADIAFGQHSENSFDLAQMHVNNCYNLNLKLEFSGLKTWALSRLFKNKTDFLKNYDKVIYSGIICPLAIQNHLNGGNYYYCHTPPRFVYDKFNHYKSQHMLPQQLMLSLLVSWYKPQYEAAVALMDVVFANSEFVKARIKKYLNRDSIVIHPPCNIDKFKNFESAGYYLSTARFDKLKRVDVIIKAFKKMPNKKLLICSTGVEENKLRKMVADCSNITLVGLVSDKQLIDLIGKCIATIYIPVDEDFGMSPVESMAAGKPVICSGHGGPTESVINKETGYFISEDNPEDSLITCINKLDASRAQSMKTACEDRAHFFSEEKFHHKIRQFVLS